MGDKKVPRFHFYHKYLGKYHLFQNSTPMKASRKINKKQGQGSREKLSHPWQEENPEKQ